MPHECHVASEFRWVASMLVRLPRIRVVAAQKRSPNAPLYAMHHLNLGGVAHLYPRMSGHDGVSYHHAYRNPGVDAEPESGCPRIFYARDRDRLREQIIRGRGWNLHRIWSTDWFLNRETEERRLQEVIESFLNAETR